MILCQQAELARQRSLTLKQRVSMAGKRTDRDFDNAVIQHERLTEVHAEVQESITDASSSMHKEAQDHLQKQLKSLENRGLEKLPAIENCEILERKARGAPGSHKIISYQEIRIEYEHEKGIMDKTHTEHKSELLHTKQRLDNYARRATVTAQEIGGMAGALKNAVENNERFTAPEADEVEQS